MIPTFIGVVVAFVGLLLLAFPAELSLAYFTYCTLMAGSSAIDLNALGGASMPPANFALVFLLVRLGRKDLGRSEPFLKSLQANALFVIFALYCGVTAFVLPRLFAGHLWLIPMIASNLGAVRLEPTAQNITTAVYLISTALTAVAACMVTYTTNIVRIMAKTFIIVTFIHVGTGLLDLGLHAIHLENLLYIVRNGHYAQLDQSIGDVHRIAGIMPEPSVYASLGGVLFTLCSEMWLRGFYTRWSGPAALCMLTMLVLATSSTGYIFIIVYGALLWLRFLFVPGGVASRKLVTFILVQIFGGAAVFLLLLSSPGVAQRGADILQSTLLTKGSTSSGIERATWAKQGLIAVKGTYGLGVGVGSFRSSSVITAILGSVGPLALAAFTAYVLQVWQPLRRSTYRVNRSESLQFAAVAGWGALMIIVGEATVAASPDPGLIFGLLAGLAIGMRSAGRTPAPQRGDGSVAVAALQVAKA